MPEGTRGLEELTAKGPEEQPAARAGRRQRNQPEAAARVPMATALPQRRGAGFFPGPSGWDVRSPGRGRFSLGEVIPNCLLVV